MEPESTKLRFIDLFAGLGGFHLALRRQGHECVFASEIDPVLRALYKYNFGIDAFGDIRGIAEAEIPPHDVVCAGFPCQPFSKAGEQAGLVHPNLGDLYLEIVRIVRFHHPTYLILENVANLERHAHGSTWYQMRTLLEGEGYHIQLGKLSPHQFGIPQIRERMYVVGSLRGLDDFCWPLKSRVPPSLLSVLDNHPADARSISDQFVECLDTWQEFLDHVPGSEKIPHPVWAMEFGATYPYEDTTPWAMQPDDLARYRGSFGQELTEASTKEDMLSLLPSHARRAQTTYPDWKVKFIRRNREFYARNREWLDSWVNRIREFPSSLQKLEWNCQEKDPSTEGRNLRQYVIQMRPSGVRIKRLDTAPTLVAMTATQVPIIAWEGRFMTPTECKRLQSMEGIELPGSPSRAYEALGNAVNVKVASLVADAVLRPPPVTARLATVPSRSTATPVGEGLLEPVSSSGIRDCYSGRPSSRGRPSVATTPRAARA